MNAEIVSYLGGKLADKAIDLFKGHVIERWSRYRATAFFESFVAASIDSSTSPEQVDAKLTAILSDDRRSEVLFDAYRSVCLSKSRDIGPRAIGLLTAHLILEARFATEQEEAWFQVFESLSDSELECVQDFYAVSLAKARAQTDKDYRINHGSVTIDWASEVTEFKDSVDRTSLNLFEALGSWAAKLQQLGIISTSIHEEIWDYPEDSERYIDMPGTARRLTNRIGLSASDEVFSDLIRKAVPPKDVVDLGSARSS